MISKIGTVYHTGTKRRGMESFNDYSKRCDRYEADGNIAFQYDLTRGMHEDFLKSDCFYSEPAWRTGYDTFVEKSGVVANGNYMDYLDSIRKVIRESGKPAYILTGKAMVKRLSPDYVFPVLFEEHGGEAVVGCYNDYKKSICTAKTNTGVMQLICAEHGTICDFSCGFGNVIPFVLAHKKKFVASDICGDCIGYIAEKYMGAEL